MPATSGLSPAAIALNRFGLGATPNDPPPVDPRLWLTSQFDRFNPLPQGFAALADPGVMVKAYRLQQQQARQTALMQPQEAMVPGKPARSAAQIAARQDFAQDVQALYRQAVQARSQSALETEAPFVERMVHFWANHFCVSADNPQTAAFVGAFERDAIRPHVLGRFEDMLLAVEHHPAMLIYLNQIQSIGPNSLAAQRASLHNPGAARGLNENLAREIMELHTLGVRSGYSQADVTEFARALTGWNVAGAGICAITAMPMILPFVPICTNRGLGKILGKTYAQAGEDQARAALIDFAHAPQTASHIATKLARHFAGDTPPPALVDRLAGSFGATRGDLPALYRTLIDTPNHGFPCR